jgi:antirestriction protein ArdC
MAFKSSDRADVYTRVTNQIIEAIEAGAESWTMPWHASDVPFSMPINAATGKAYRGINVISLWAIIVLDCSQGEP